MRDVGCRKRESEIQIDLQSMHAGGLGKVLQQHRLTEAGYGLTG